MSLHIFDLSQNTAGKQSRAGGLELMSWFPSLDKAALYYEERGKYQEDIMKPAIYHGFLEPYTWSSLFLEHTTNVG